MMSLKTKKRLIESHPDTETDDLKTVLRIRIYYYADPDPGSKKCPYGSGS